MSMESSQTVWVKEEPVYIKLEAEEPENGAGAQAGHIEREVQEEAKWESETITQPGLYPHLAIKAGTQDGHIECEVKEEPEFASKEGVCGVSKVVVTNLYSDHTVKEELVVGPEEVHRPKVVLTYPGFANFLGLSPVNIIVLSSANSIIGCSIVCGISLIYTRKSKDIPYIVAASPRLDERSDLASRACSVILEAMHVDLKRRTCIVGLQVCKFHLCRIFEQDIPTRKESHLSRNKLSRHPQQDYRRKQQKITSSMDDKLYKCHYCSFASAHKDHLKSHEKEHTGDKPYKCAQCSFSSDHRNSLYLHVKVHSNEKQYKCAHCSYSSVYKSSLRIHVKSHTGDKPYKCAHCSYSSIQKSSLKVHVRTHTGEKPYKCAHCSYSSASISNFKVHELTHSGEKPYKCANCSYSCVRKSNLKVHETTHSSEKPYQCAQCSYSSGHKSGLQAHLKIHTDIKPYKCAHCTFASIRKRDLVVHLRTHMGERPYKCANCDYSCIRKDRLKVHEKTHTQEIP